ncbi:MAG TPA: hypothetical protein V6C57_04515 [Coleofasciculaceae cyanobacterium]
MLESSVSLTSPINPAPAFSATPPTAVSAVALPTSGMLRADQIFFDGLTAMAVVPLLLIAFCSLHQAWRSYLHQRKIQILEKLWQLTTSQFPPLK